MRKHLIYIGILFSFLAYTQNAYSQITQTISYTTREGLPSNSVYRSIIDKKGFLWVATEIGLARFDGKSFRNYSTVDGLTDNEITDLFIDSSGVIWVIPFRRTPCYYNATTDRFENEDTDIEIKKIELNTAYRPHILQFGGVAFCNINREVFISKNKKTYLLPHILSPKSTIPVNIIEYKKNSYLLIAEDSIKRYSNGKTEALNSLGRYVVTSEIVGNNIYISTTNSILVYSYTNNGDIRFIKEKIFPFSLRIFCKTGKHFAITSLNGTTYLLDKNTLEPLEIVSATDGVPVRNVLEDNDDNIWLSTIDKGLIKVQKKRISVLDNADLKQGFNSVLKTKNLIAGNNNGEIFNYDGLYVKKLFLNKNKNIDGWVRKIINTKYGIYIATQSGSFLIDEKTFSIKKAFNSAGAPNMSTKAAHLINDSMMLLGGHAYTYLYNIKKMQATDSIAKRVVSLGTDKTGNIYIGSNEGLFLWKNKQLQALGEKRKSLSYKINTLVCSPDNLMWIGLGADSLIVLKENKWIASIPLGSNIPGTGCKSLFCNKQGEVWLGTNKGVNRINYTYNGEGFNYISNYFGTSDGLIGEQVNDISIQDSTVYMATNEGLNIMPVNLQLPVTDIPTFITKVEIADIPVELQSEYQLGYKEKNFNIEFSGVDLTGFIPRFEYNINDGAWQPTEKIYLKRLTAGTYKIKIRAIRRDGQPSKIEATAVFKIANIFWKSSIFWTFFALSVFGLILYFQQKRNKQKQKIAIEKISTEKRLTELEMQALKAQINPHFVFNCLNSIKGFIYEKDYTQADKYLDKFSELMRSTIDNSDAAIISLKNEISYLDNYLQLEKLRFDKKFDYAFHIAKNINQDAVYVPAMLLQPYVENAIRHGMRFLENKKGLILISATQDANTLICTIDDNGIGREKATALKSKMHIEYQSKGMSISKRRAELYDIKQEIIDKKDENENPVGTTIIVKIPLTLQP
ncbi:MAG: histidine kinase [Chitinophagaceae bacterium]|nr:histidine kinase [Chitinophagaceae bacterium]